MVITADDFFVLFINGTQVDQSRPDRSDENVWQQVHQIAARPYLRRGKNVLIVRATNAAGAAGLVARLELSGDAAIETDTRWQTYEARRWQAATIVAPLTGGTWAGRLLGWPGYEEAFAPHLSHLRLPFARSVIVHPGSGTISLRDADPSGILRVSPPPTGTVDTPSILLDFGKEIAGRVLIYPLSSGTVLVGTGEFADEAVQLPWGGAHRIVLERGSYSTVTDFARLRGWSISRPRASAIK